MRSERGVRRIAFRLPDGGVWTGGVNYLETVCKALLEHRDLGFEPVVFCNPAGDPRLLLRFQTLLGECLIREAAIAGKRGAGLVGALLFGRNGAALRLCKRHRCDVIMEAADYTGWRFPAACLAWVPDFQDRHLPQLFSRWNLRRKSLGLRLQLIIAMGGRDVPADMLIDALWTHADDVGSLGARRGVGLCLASQG